MAGEAMEAPITINIGNLCDGAIVEAFDTELAKVLANILDPNTEARDKREITFTVKFHPKDDRVQINTTFECKTKLAGLMAATSRMFIGRDDTGVLYGLSEDPRQMNIFVPPAPKAAPSPIPFSSGATK
jgi:hypothetical protein